MAAERIALAAEQGDDGRLLERVQRAVHGLVMAGEASSQRIAELLGVQERVLRRRLQAMVKPSTSIGRSPVSSERSTRVHRIAYDFIAHDSAGAIVGQFVFVARPLLADLDR